MVVLAIASYENTSSMQWIVAKVANRQTPNTAKQKFLFRDLPIQYTSNISHTPDIYLQHISYPWHIPPTYHTSLTYTSNISHTPDIYLQHITYPWHIPPIYHIPLTYISNIQHTPDIYLQHIIYPWHIPPTYHIPLTYTSNISHTPDKKICP